MVCMDECTDRLMGFLIFCIKNMDCPTIMEPHNALDDADTPFSIHQFKHPIMHNHMKKQQKRTKKQTNK